MTFPFEPRAKGDLKGLAVLGERQLRYLRELAVGETVMTEIEGFGPGAADYDFCIENRKAGANVRITGDRPLSKVIFWSIRTTLCPEPYIDIKVPPGQEFRWTPPLPVLHAGALTGRTPTGSRPRSTVAPS